MVQKSATQFTPQRPSAVTAGMSEIDAGNAISDYMERVQDATGVNAEDVDVFDGDRDWDAVSTRLQGAQEQEGEDPGSAETAAQATADDATEAEKTDENDKDDETEKTDADSDNSSEENDADALTLEASTLAAMLGVDESTLAVGDDGAVLVNYQVDGERGQTTLQDVVKSYQLQKHVNRKSQQLSEEAKQLRETALQREQALHAAVGQAQAFQQVMEDRIASRYGSINWEELKAEDPGRYAALQVEMSTELQTVRSEAQRVMQAANEQAQYARHVQQQQHQQWLADQRRQLFEHLPELADADKQPEILRSYHDYLTGYGFSPDEVQTIQDHRMMRVIADAVAYRELGGRNGAKRAAPPVQKRLVKVPRVAKGSSPRTEADQRDDRRRGSMARLRKSGSDDDAARFLVESGVADAVLGE